MYNSEQIFAQMLDKQKRKWIYHPKRFKLKNTSKGDYLAKHRLIFPFIISLILPSALLALH
jgi:hypothetical protein